MATFDHNRRPTPAELRELLGWWNRPDNALEVHAELVRALIMACNVMEDQAMEIEKLKNRADALEGEGRP